VKKAGVKNYEEFAKSALKAIPDLPISLKYSRMTWAVWRERHVRSQAGAKCYIKIPVTNTKGDSTATLVKKLSQDGLKLNVTAILTIDQVKQISHALSSSTPSIVSVFAGTIADTGRDPCQ